MKQLKSLRFAALTSLLLLAAASLHAAAVTTKYVILFDVDNSSATGCTYTAGTTSISGIEHVLTTTVDRNGSSATVTKVERQQCVGGTLSTPAITVDAGGWPAATGPDGTMHVVTRIPNSAFGTSVPARMRLYLGVIETGGASFIETAPDGGPILYPVIGLRHRAVAHDGTPIEPVTPTLDGTIAMFNGLPSMFLGTPVVAGTPLQLVSGFFGLSGASDIYFLINIGGGATGSVVAVDDSYTMQQGHGIASGPPGILANDINTTGSTLFAQLMSSTHHGTLTVNADGSFSYHNNGALQTTDNFTYKATAGGQTSDPATVTFHILPDNPPVGVADAYSIPHAGTLNVPPPGVLVNDTDADHDPITAVIETQPLHASNFHLNNDGSFTYTHDGSNTLSDTFTYRATDLIVPSFPVTVTITIGPDMPPVTTADAYTTAEGSTLTVPVGTGLLANDTDPDTPHAALTATLGTPPSHGNVVINPDGSFVYTHDGSETTSDSFTYIANDGITPAAATTVTLTITPVNDAPVLNGQTLTIAEDTPTAINTTATDAEGDTLTYQLLNPPSHGSLSGTLPNVTYTPNANYNGTDSFVVVASDGKAQSAAATISITINPVDDAPVAVNDVYAATPNATLTISAVVGVLANDFDVDGDTIQAVLGVGPTHASSFALNPDGSFNYTPNNGYTGSDSFTYRAQETTGGVLQSNLATVTFNIHGTNQAPVANNQTVSTNEDTPLGIVLTGSDPDGDAITFAANAPAHGVLTGTAPNLTYTPDANYNGADSFTFTVSDGSLTGNGTININIAPVNDAPVASPDVYGTLKNTPLVVNAATGVLLNDSDADGNSLTAVLDASAAHASSFALNPDGSFSYTPVNNFVGTDSFTYHAFDGSVPSGTVTVTINVKNTNTAPTANSQSVTTNEDTAVAITLTGSDPDADPLSYVIATPPAHGSLSGAAPSVLYTPAPNYFGPDSFTFTVSDGIATSAAATVSITINHVNHAPVANNDSFSTSEDAGTSGNVLTNDTDSDGDTMHAVLVGNVSNGTLNLNLDGSFTYTPNANFNGIDGFTYTANDASLPSNVAHVTINVGAVNDVPAYTAGSNVTVLEDSGAYSNTWATSVSAGPADEAWQTVNFIVSNDNNALFSAQPAIAANGTLTFTPAANANGTATVTVQLHDNGGTANGGVDTTTAQTFTITITGVNDVPSFTKGGDQTVLEDSGAQTVNGWATGISAGPNEPSQTVHFNITGNTNPTLFSAGPAVSANGTLTYTPAANANGTATITLNIQDDGGTANGGVDTSGAQTFVINVTAVNDAPSFTKGADVTVLEDSGAFSQSGWATSLSAGPSDESGQTLTFNVTNNTNAALFSVQPAISSTGTLTFTPAANAFGSATITINLQDNGGTANGGADTSATQTFVINITGVNDVPSFTKGADATVLEDSGAFTQAGWATGISAGPNEGSQTVHFNITGNTNPGLFSVTPAVSATGTLTFTPAANANGTATITLNIQDDGGTANGGVDTSTTQTFVINVTAVNDVPSFTKGADQTVFEDSGAQTVVGWATAISAGPADESGQALTFNVTNNTNAALFSVQPAISSTGTLTYTPAANAFGSATITIDLQDNGGTANGGVDTSATQTFVINVTGVNDAPSFTKGADQTTLEDSGPQTANGWATAISAGVNEGSQTVDFIVTNDNNGLFSVQPAIDASGNLTYTPAANANGLATVSVKIHDDGGTANGGVDTSATQTFTITVTPVNDAPSFTKGADVTVLEDSGAFSQSGWATSLSTGPSDESGQTLSFNVTNNTNAALFSVQPAISSTGTLTFTPAANAFGSATITIDLQDNGGTLNGGADTSATQTFVINITGVNDAPSFTKGADATVLEDSGAFTQAGWATGISAGPNEGSQTVHFNITGNTNSGLFSVQPAVSATGTLTFTPAANANGTATITLDIQDDGGTANSGVDTSTTQTFVINVTAVNDAPSFTKGADVTVLEDSGAFSQSGWATSLSTGPADESGQTLTFNVTNNTNAALFSVQPAISSTGTLTFTPAANAFGSATITIDLQDNGGTANGGADTSATQTFVINITGVNDAPSFTKGADATVLEDSGAFTQAGWATGISAGPNEGSQTVQFNITGNTNSGLFSVQPAVSPTGTLTFTPAANANGTATITLDIQDDGGTANSGVDTSATQTFVINVTAVNDAPSFTKGADQTVLEDSGAQTVLGWATAMSAGPADESGQALNFIVSNDNNALFSSQPAVDASGNLTYTPAANAFGSATVTVQIHDNGGTANSGVDTSAAQTFTITVTGVNDAPSFTKGADQTTLEDSGPQTANGWATAISAGPSEGGQTVDFIVTNDNNGLFSSQPAVDASGNLTYTPAANANGVATVSVKIHDDGGTANSGVDTSATQTFTITITPVNDAPSFTKGADVTVLEDSGAFSQSGWATSLSAGPADESGQTLNFIVSNDNNALFSIQPAVSATGTLTFTPAANAFGTATVSVQIHDNGGTANSGADTSAVQTFVINVTGVNDAPSFTKGADVTVLEDSGAFSQGGWATGISAGPNESGQTVHFNITNNTNPTLFAAGPAVSATGTLTFTPAANANGTATITLDIQDDGGTANSGVDTSATQTFVINVTAVNDAPSFTKGADVTVLEDSGAFSQSGWATAISAGPADESGQTVHFNITGNTNSGLFSVQPAVSATGALTFTTAANANGSSTITLNIQDDGGTANSGVDTSATQTFVINVTAVNDPPSFTKGADVTVLEDSGAFSQSNWATAISAGPANEAGQTVSFLVSNDNNSLFSVQPAVSSTGTLTFTPAANANGSTTVTISAQDNGGTLNGGNDTSPSQTFTITVTAVNDAPTFSITPPASPSPYFVLENSGAHTISNFISSISAGPANESGQTVTLSITNNTNPGMFSVAPSIDNSGTLTFTLAANTGDQSATLTFKAQDDGGTANGGVNNSTQTYTLVVEAAPKVLSVTPTNGSTVTTTTPITVTLSESVAATTSSFTVTCNSVAQTFTLSASPATTFTLTPTTVGGTKWTAGTCNASVLAAGISDVDTFDPPDNMAGDFNWSFTTNSPPSGIDHSISEVGNVTVTIGAPGLLAGSSDPDAGQTLTVVSGTFPTNGGGSVTYATDGSFVYTPAAGAKNTTDTVNYTISDGAGGTVTKALSIVIQNSRVWFVKDTGVGSGGTGTQANPFATMAQAFAVVSSGETIYVIKGAGATGLDNTSGHAPPTGITMIGEGVSSNQTVLLAHHLLDATISDTTVTLLSATGLPATITRSNAGATMTIANAGSDTIQGLIINSTNGTAITAAAAIGTLTMNNGVTITATGGPAISLPGGALAATVDSVTVTNSASDGFTLTGVTGSLTVTAGTISGGATTGFGLNVSGGTATINMGATFNIAASKGGIAQIVNRTGVTPGTITLSGSMTSADKGVVITGNTTAQTISVSGPLTLNLGSTTNAGVTISGNTNATINFSNTTNITTGTGTGFSATTGGTLNVSGTATVTTGAATAGVNINGVTVGGTGVTFASVTTNGATTGISLTSLGNGNVTINGGNIDGGTTGVSLTTLGTSNVTLNGVTIGGTTRPTTGITGTTFGTLTISGTVIVKGATALNLTTGAVSGTFNTVDANAGTNGVSLNGVTGSWGATNGTLTGGTGAEFLVTGGSGGTISWGAATAITQSNAANVVTIGGSNSNTINFAGTVTSSGTGTGLSISASSGTYNFNGTNAFTGAGGIVIANGESGTITFSSNTTNTASGTSFQVDGSVAAVTAAITYSGTINKTSAGRMIDVNKLNSPGTLTMSHAPAASGNLTNNNAAATGIIITNSSSTNITIANASVSVGSSAAAFTGSGNTGGTINLQGIAIANNGNKQGMLISGAGTINVTSGFAASSINGTGGTAAAIDGTTSAYTGTLNLTNVAITTNAGGGVFLSSSTLGGTGSTINGSGSGLVLSSVALTNGAGMTSITSTGGANGVSLTSVTGGTYTISGGALGGNSAGEFVVSGGTATVTYNGTISSGSAAKLVNVSSYATGTLTFGGAITGTTNATGITLGGASGTITFTAGITLDGTSDTFTASNGAAPGFTLNVTGTNKIGNTTAPTGAALTINNTTIGASHVTFQKISATGGTNAIVLTTTGSTGHFALTGDGTNANNASGGTMQNQTGDAILMSSTQAPSFRQISIQHSTHNGIKGSSGVTDFSLTWSTINDSGLSGNGTTIVGTVDDSNINFGTHAAGTENNLSGNITITNNTLTNAFYNGIYIYNFAGTISNAAVSNNVITSSTTTANSLSSGISWIAFGSAGGVASITKATVDSNNIQHFPQGAGIAIQCGNSTSSGAPSGTYGDNTDATNVNAIRITNNIITGGSVQMNTDAILATIGGRGNGNFFIDSNGSVATPLGNTNGHVISVQIGGIGTLRTTINNNRIVANNVVGSRGITVTETNQFATSDAPTMLAFVTNNNISATNGCGIFIESAKSGGTLKATVTGNTVGKETQTVAEGAIQVWSGDSSATTNVHTTVCLTINTNTATGGTNSTNTQTAPGIGIRLQANSVPNSNTFAFNINGFGFASGTVGQMESYVGGQNPGSNCGTFGTCNGGGAYAVTNVVGYGNACSGGF